jgi:hypothetical protein
MHWATINETLALRLALDGVSDRDCLALWLSSLDFGSHVILEGLFPTGLIEWHLNLSSASSA